MLTNELLEARYRAQRALADQGGDDLHAYAQNIHRIVRDAERKHGLKFRYRHADKKTVPVHDMQTKSSSGKVVA